MRSVLQQTVLLKWPKILQNPAKNNLIISTFLLLYELIVLFQASPDAFSILSFSCQTVCTGLWEIPDAAMLLWNPAREGRMSQTDWRQHYLLFFLAYFSIVYIVHIPLKNQEGSCFFKGHLCLNKCYFSITGILAEFLFRFGIIYI